MELEEKSVHSESDVGCFPVERRIRAGHSDLCRRVHIDPPIPSSAKRECECLHAGIKELDLECSIFHWSFLPDELIEPVPLDCS